MTELETHWYRETDNNPKCVIFLFKLKKNNIQFTNGLGAPTGFISYKIKKEISYYWWMAKRCCSYFIKEFLHLQDMLSNVYILKKRNRKIYLEQEICYLVFVVCTTGDIIGPLPETNRWYHWSKSVATTILWNKIIANYRRPLITSIHYSYQP